MSDTEWIVERAKSLGFDLCGVADADGLADTSRVDEWLARGYAGEMRSLHDARRGALTNVLPGAKSVIICALNYNTAHPYSTEAAAQAAAGDEARGWISRYAWGDDYHEVVGAQLDRLVAAMREHFGGDFVARAYVDTGPVPERAAARAAGLGWLAKNTCLINRELGSWLFLGVVVTSLELAPTIDDVAAAAAAMTPAMAATTMGVKTEAAADLCGQCRLCIDACPTGALVEEYVMDARRCISYLTIELRGAIPEEFRAAMGWQAFGCDICQDVCPWNRAAPAATVAAVKPRTNLLAPELLWLLSLDQEAFRTSFRGSAIKRTKWRGLVRNACIAAGNARVLRDDPGSAQSVALRERLSQLAACDDELIAEHAAWALKRCGTG